MPNRPPSTKVSYAKLGSQLWLVWKDAKKKEPVTITKKKKNILFVQQKSGEELAIYYAHNQYPLNGSKERKSFILTPDQALVDKLTKPVEMMDKKGKKLKDINTLLAKNVDKLTYQDLLHVEAWVKNRLR